MNGKNLNRAELIELVRKIINAEGSEAEIDDMIQILEQNVLDPQVSDYIYCDNKTSEEVVDKALAYKPILL